MPTREELITRIEAAQYMLTKGPLTSTGKSDLMDLLQQLHNELKSPSRHLHVKFKNK